MSDAQIRLFELKGIPYGAIFETPAGRIMKLGIHEGSVKPMDITKRYKRHR